MSRGIYTAASGGIANLVHLDIVANNIANVNTVGFKSQKLITTEREFGNTLAASLTDNPPISEAAYHASPGTEIVETVTDFSQGPIQETNNPLNVAIAQDNAFFTTIGQDGEILYTRAGNFLVDSDGALATPDGMRVFGNGGAINLPIGADIRISRNGTVTANGEPLAQLRIATFQDVRQLERVGGTKFRKLPGTPDPAILTNANLVPGSVEMPNTNIVNSMIQMISVQRAFESYQKTVRTIDELNETNLRTNRGN